MAGAGFHDFVAGDILTAAQVDTYLMQQTVMTFASDAARDTALSGSLSEGLHCYTTDNNRHYYYTGAAWTVLTEPPQSWAPVVTQGSSVAGTVNRGWYRRSNGLFEARLVWTASAGGTPSEPISVATPVTLADLYDAHGTFSFFDTSITATFAGSIRPSTTISITFIQDGALDVLGVASPTIASGDGLFVSLFGRY
jgi:hypothetical protein